MSTGNGTPLAIGRPSPAISRELLAVGIALRMAFVGVGLAAVGLIATIDGGVSPLTATLLIVGGAVIAMVSVRYVMAWSASESASTSPGAAPASRSSMHQPVLAGE